MNNIGNYKKRFFNLMESTMGDVKPLIVENNGTVDITTHRESCGQKLIGKQFSFIDIRGLRKEEIKITITEITYDLATQGNMFQHKQNVAARSGENIAIVKGTYVGQGDEEFEFTSKCQKGRFTLTSEGGASKGLEVGDVYECQKLWFILYYSMYICDNIGNFKGNGRDTCSI